MKNETRALAVKDEELDQHRIGYNICSAYLCTCVFTALPLYAWVKSDRRELKPDVESYTALFITLKTVTSCMTKDEKNKVVAEQLRGRKKLNPNYLLLYVDACLCTRKAEYHGGKKLAK